MFLITSFSMERVNEVSGYFNTLVFFLVLVVATLFFVYKIVQHLGEPKRRWLDNIPKALKILEEKRLSKTECLFLLQQTMTSPKERDAEALFLKVYFYERLKKEVSVGDFSFLAKNIYYQSQQSKFFAEIVVKTKQLLAEKSAN